MTYTPKPGDRVISPLLVGEWETVRAATGAQWVVEREGRRLTISALYLTPVAPLLPPEPAVGEVVWVEGLEGRYWMHAAGANERWLCEQRGRTLPQWCEWDEIADLAVPVVPVSRVADWMDQRGYTDEEIDYLRREFGWDR